MSKKHIATIDIFVDDESNDPSGLQATNLAGNNHELGTDTYEIVLRPNAERNEVNKGLENLTDRERFQTVLCHELGHAVEYISRDPVVHPMYSAIHGKEDNERKAWKLAEQMHGCYVDPTIRRRCLATYDELKKLEESDPELTEMRNLVKAQLVRKGNTFLMRQEVK